MSKNFLGPSAGLSIRSPTDKGQRKGNIDNPPRYQDLAMGGANGPNVRGFEKNGYRVEPPGSTQRRVPQVKGGA